MAGNGKATHRGSPATTLKNSLRRKSSSRIEASNKKQRVPEVIEISSSKSSLKILEKEDMCTQSSAPKKTHVNDQVNQSDEVTNLKGTVDTLKEMVMNITKVVFSPAMPTFGVPWNSLSFNTPQDLFKANESHLETPVLQCTKSEPCLKGLTTNEIHGATQDSLAPRRLFYTLEEHVKSEYYLNYDFLHTTKYAGRRTRISIPEWLPVLFKPPRQMILDEIEAATAAYLFAISNDNEQKGKEVLIETSFGYAERAALKTLIPKEMLDQEVLNMLVCFLTLQERSLSKDSITWFFPTTFAQYGLGNRGHTPWKDVKDYYKEEFMGSVEKLSKIFVPINDEENKHWFLLVVDIRLHQLIVLDSLASPKTYSDRRRYARRLAMFIEQMLQDESFYDKSSTEKVDFTNFSVGSPDFLPKQKIGSNDCGIWVARWMTECVWTNDYEKIKVDDATRMRIALDLVLKPYNKIKDDVIRKAFMWLKGKEDNHKALVKK